MGIRRMSRSYIVSTFACMSAVGALGACSGEPAADQPLEEEAAVVAAGLAEAPAPLGCSPGVDVDPARSLMVTDAAVLARFSLKRVFDQLLSLADVSGPDALGLYQRWWDSQNASLGGVFPDAIHCNDEVNAAGAPSINGFPIQCPRNEGALALSNPFLDLPVNLDFMKPVAVVNRFDLAPLDGAHCGEYRIIYAKRSGELLPINRNLIILEGVLPNPDPSCGVAACSPVAELWATLSSIGDANARADALEDFYFSGLPGFAPVIHPAHFSEGGGQIRTNQFMSGLNQQIWQLREFQLARVCSGAGGACRLVVKPVTVKNNPSGALFNVNASDARTSAFQSDFLGQVQALLPQDVNAMSMSTPDLFNAGQSNAQGNENEYAFHLAQGGAGNAFAQAISAELASQGSSLGAANVADRATAQSCGGCHELSSGDGLGGTQWPAHAAANTFVHVNEKSQLSAPLVQFFLPHRKQVLESFLATVGCSSCEAGSGAAARAASAGAAGARTLGGSTTH